MKIGILSLGRVELTLESYYDSVEHSYRCHKSPTVEYWKKQNRHDIQYSAQKVADLIFAF